MKPETMKFADPKTVEECLDVLERSIILPRLWGLQNHKFCGVFMADFFAKREFFYAIFCTVLKLAQNQ